MRRRRWRSAVLWVGWTFCVLIATTFVVSAWWRVTVEVTAPYGPCLLLNNGRVVVVMDDSARNSLSVQPISPWDLSLWNTWHVGKSFSTQPASAIPLYAAFAAVAIPTLLVWRFVPKFPCGHCRRCGYNLTGLTEPRCPECGAGFDTDESAV